MTLFRRRKRDAGDLDLTEVITESLAKPLPPPHIQTSPSDDPYSLGLNRDLWPAIVPPSASSSPTRSRTDWTLNLAPQPHTPLPTSSPRRVRGVRTTTEPTQGDETSSESNEEQNFLARGPWAARQATRAASAPMLKRPRPGKGSDTTFGGGGVRSDTQSHDSYATPGSPTSSASQQLAVASALTPPPLSPRRSQPTYSPRDWQYQVAETLYLTGGSSPSSYQDATFGSHRTSPAPSRLSRLMGRRSSNLSLRPRRSDSTAPQSTSESGRTRSSDPHSPTSPTEAAAPIRRLKSMPSLVEPSASDDESESSESWADAAEEVSAAAAGRAEEEETTAPLPTPDQPTIRLVRVRLSKDAAVIYDYERANRVSSTSTIKAPFFDRANALYFSPSPPISPSRRFSTIPRRRADADVIEIEEREAHSDSELELDSSYDHIELPFPPEPIRSKHAYQPALSANFLSAPPSKLRRQFLREQRRRARTRSMPVRPTSIIGPYLHPPPARAHSSVDVSSAGREEEPSTYLDESMRGPTTRLSPYDERMGRSLWSLSTHAAERARHASGQTMTTDGDGTTQTSGIPTSRIGLFFYTLRCVPPAAWLFVFGFLFPPLWWFGSFFPIVSRTGKKEHWGSLRSSPLLDTASTPQPPSTPSARTPPPITGYRLAHEGLLPPETASVDRVPGPKRLSDFLSEVPNFDSDEEATFWAAQKSIWRWRLRCRVMSLLSIVIVVPLIVFGAISPSW